MRILESGLANEAATQRRAKARGIAGASRCLLILDVLALGVCCAAPISTHSAFSELCGGSLFVRYFLYEQVCIYMAMTALLFVLLIVKENRMKEMRTWLGLIGVAMAVVGCVSQSRMDGGSPPDVRRENTTEVTQSRVNGMNLEEQFKKDGTGSRFAVRVMADELDEVLISKEGAKAYFNTMMTFLAPVVLKQSEHPGRYEIEAVVAAIDTSQRPITLNLPFGPGTVYELYGEVKLFGHVFASTTADPLVFLVHDPTGDETCLQFVHVGGVGRAVCRDGKEVVLKN